MLFVSHLANLRLTHSTIEVYLSSIHHLHVTQGKYSQFSTELTPHLQQVLKGIKKLQTITSHPRLRRPITLEIMQGIKSMLLSQSDCYHNTMITDVVVASQELMKQNGLARGIWSWWLCYGSFWEAFAYWGWSCTEKWIVIVMSSAVAMACC